MWRAAPGSTGSPEPVPRPVPHKAASVATLPVHSGSCPNRVSYELCQDAVMNASGMPCAQLGTPPTVSLLAEAQQFIERRSLPASLDELELYNEWRKQYPCILTRFDDFLGLLKGKRLAVFLDYDGTLTPIVSNPDEALMSQQMRDVVRRLAQLYPVAIISGRGREKLENFVQLQELYYAGSHGMDIAGPTDLDASSAGGCDITFQPAAHFRPLIDTVYSELCAALADIPGSSVEHNTFCVSAHFRNCPGDTWQQVVSAVEDIVGRNSELRMTRGRKVVEVRPKVNWHKGTALVHLLDVLGLSSSPDVVSIYIGDDHTDEDAFRTLKESGRGVGILVTTKVKETTEALYTVREPAEVGVLLQRLVTWGADSADNGWRREGGGNGWAHMQDGARARAAAAKAAACAAGSAGNGQQSPQAGLPRGFGAAPGSPAAAAGGGGGGGGERTSASRPGALSSALASCGSVPIGHAASLPTAHQQQHANGHSGEQGVQDCNQPANHHGHHHHDNHHKQQQDGCCQRQEAAQQQHASGAAASAAAPTPAPPAPVGT